MTATVIRNARVLTCDAERGGVGLIDSGAVVLDGDRIAWIGPDGERPGYHRSDARELDARGRLVTPGLVDCHTHALFAGDRANEFAMRARGATYLEIAAAGGGIAATLGPTRAATDHELRALLDARLDAALAHGTTSIEVKTGYDLTTEGELRLLRVLGGAAAARVQQVAATLLVHAVPPERRADRAAYVEEMCTRLIPAAAALPGPPSSVDIYVDEGAYTLAEARAILTAARGQGLAVRAHAGQFRDLGAAELLGELGALSADHLEQISAAGIAALARAGTVAVMLPGACVQLRLSVPPVEQLRAAGVAMAVATDLNPGSSYSESLPLQMWLATTHFGMTVDEAWLGVTRHAARALGAEVACGALFGGARADLVLWQCTEPAHVPYHYGANLVDAIYVAGARYSKT